MILLAPSGSGKTVLLSNLLLNIYRGCFESIFVFSPSIDIDKTWEPVKKHQEDDMKAIEKARRNYILTTTTRRLTSHHRHAAQGHQTNESIHSEKAVLHPNCYR